MVVEVRKAVDAMIRMVPMITVMGAIFFLSHQPSGRLDLPKIPFFDKIGHFAIYGLLALTVLYIPSQAARLSRPKTIVAVTVLFCTLFGITDEFHQSFVPGRDVSPADIAADTCGAAAAGLLWLQRRYFRRG